MRAVQPGDTSQETHCDAASEHSHEVNQQEIQEPKPVYVATAQKSSFQVIPPCDHCFGRSEPVRSYVMLREKVQPQRVTDALPPSASQSHHGRQFSFKLPVITRQGAPPVAPTRRNILFSIFLI